MTKASNPIKSLLLLVILGFIWGTGYSIARFAMTNGVQPLGYSFWQSLGPAIIIGAISLTQADTFTFSINRLRYYLICALTGIVIPNTTMYFAAPHLPASILAMVVNTVPVLAYPMALYARLESFNWQRAIGILVAFIALMMIILPASSLPETGMTGWVITTLITPVSFAFCSVFIARYRPEGSSTISLTAGMLVLSSLILIPFVIATNSFYLLHYPLLLADWVILLEIVLSSLGYWLFFKLIKIAGPVYYSLVDTIVVLTGVLWGYIIFDEHLNRWTGSAVILILIALFLTTQKQSTAAHLEQD